MVEGGDGETEGGGGGEGGSSVDEGGDGASSGDKAVARIGDEESWETSPAAWVQLRQQINAQTKGLAEESASGA